MAQVDDMEVALSAERFRRYVALAAGDRIRALELYTHNTQVSEALYIALHTLEVTLRNRIHRVMAEQHGVQWFDVPGIITVRRQSDQIAHAIRKLRDEKKAPTPDGIVATLSFSFWTAMFSPDYEDLWRSCLRNIARREGKGLVRKDFSRPLTQIRLLRNRTAHHEPILHWDLRRHHQSIRDLTLWLSPPAFAWSAPLDRFEGVLDAEADAEADFAK